MSLSLQHNYYTSMTHLISPLISILKNNQLNGMLYFSDHGRRPETSLPGPQGETYASQRHYDGCAGLHQ